VTAHVEGKIQIWRPVFSFIVSSSSDVTTHVGGKILSSASLLVHPPM
jgi:hypothetical protein